jgi:hypothetical protein
MRKSFCTNLFVRTSSAPQHKVAIKDNRLPLLRKPLNRRNQSSLVLINVVNLSRDCPVFQTALFLDELARSCMPHAKFLANWLQDECLAYRVNPANEQCHF